MKDPTRRGHLVAALLAVAAVAGFALLAWWLRSPAASETAETEGFSTTPEATPWPTDDARYVGSHACARCHAEQARAFRGSHHARATEPAAGFVDGPPFDGRVFERDGFRARFLREDDRALVQIAEGGAPARTYVVHHALGVEPFRQYVVDVGDGRLQALTVAWDARPVEVGGQRLFDPNRRQPEPGEPHHFLSDDQNDNSVCAGCHRTATEVGWDEGAGRFETRDAEASVGCEACHGPGSVHVSWAQAGASGAPQGLVADLHRAAAWTIAEGQTSAEPRAAEVAAEEVRVCAPCHARRDQLAEGHRPGAPLLDAYRPELLSRRLYHHDGQIDGEVYEWGSFRQSRMFHAGVRCSDCHEPHSLALRSEGDALCTSCHRPSAYDQEHHHHRQAVGSACVDCHMREKIYFEVDGRRDHSFRIPRPDLATKLGVPDACTGCHEDRGSAWAAERVTEWFGDVRRPHFGEVLLLARQHDPAAADALSALAADISSPAIVRATALALADDFPGPESDEALRAGARSREPLVRLGAAYGARELAPEDRYRSLSPLVRDEMRVVRLEAARTLAVVPPGTLASDEAEALRAAEDELAATERSLGYRPDAWLRLGLLALDRGDLEGADRAWRQALVVAPRFTPAMVSLADLERAEGDEVEAEALLRRAVEIDDTDAEALHALGLLLVRTGQSTHAVDLFRRAVELRADNPRFHYLLGVALHDTGDLRGAIAALERGVDAHPNDPDLRRTLAAYEEEARAR